MDALNYAVDAHQTPADDDAALDQLCEICLVPIETGSNACHQMPCGHRFHRRCVIESFLKLKKQERQCGYCRTGFAELLFQAGDGKFVDGLHSKESLRELLASSSCAQNIDWDTLPVGAYLFVHKGRNASNVGRFLKISKDNKNVTLSRVTDNQRITCVSHNLSHLVADDR